MILEKYSGIKLVFDFRKKKFNFGVCKKLKMKGLKLKQRKNSSHFIFLKNVISTPVLFFSFSSCFFYF